MVRQYCNFLIALTLLSGGIAEAQDPYLRPSIERREAMADAGGVIPQPYLALSHANVVDVRSGRILEDVTVVVRDGRIESVGERVPRGAERVDLLGRYVTPGFFEGHFHGGSTRSWRTRACKSTRIARCTAKKPCAML